MRVQDKHLYTCLNVEGDKVVWSFQQDWYHFSSVCVLQALSGCDVSATKVHLANTVLFKHSAKLMRRSETHHQCER